VGGEVVVDGGGQAAPDVGGGADVVVVCAGDDVVHEEEEDVVVGGGEVNTVDGEPLNGTMMSQYELPSKKAAQIMVENLTIYDGRLDYNIPFLMFDLH
jgi:hypothetical protein